MKKIFFVLLLLFNITIVHAINVSSFDELVDAVNNGEQEIKIINDITYNDTISITSNIKINGNDKKMSRDSSFTGTLFNVTDIGSLEIENLTIDGGAPGWKMDFENRYYTGANDTGYVRTPTISDDNDIIATSSLITTQGKLVIKDSSINNVRSTSSGGAINGKGEIILNNSSFKHICSSNRGGVVYMNGGTITVTKSNSEDNVAGCGNASPLDAGFILIENGNLITIKDNTTIKDNYAQGNGGAICTLNTDTIIDNTSFTHNMAGNDGSAICIRSDSNTVFKLENSIFRNNMGFATTGQSLGTIWLVKFDNIVDNPMIFKNLEFDGNSAFAGGAIADASNNPYIYMENIEVFNNKINKGSFIYCQRVNYNMKKINVHDNDVSSGAFMYNYGCSVEIDDSTITKNKSRSAGGAIYTYYGPVTIKNTQISYNESTESGAGAIYVRGYYTNANPKLTIENSIITNNKAKTTGGGIAVVDYDGIFSLVTIDDKTKIVDNQAEESADDFVYLREKNVENPNGKTISLNNISIAGIIGVDGWYNDKKDDRFLDTPNPTKFNDFVNYDGYRLYLKAAGISSIDYNLNGGKNKNIIPLRIRYGQTITISDYVPVKDNYNFLGWNTKEDGSGLWLKQGDTYDGKQGLVLYAQYEEIPKKVEEKKKDVLIKPEKKETKNIVEENPPTSDSIILTFFLLIVSIMCIVLFLKYKNKDRFNKS